MALRRVRWIPFLTLLLLTGGCVIPLFPYSTAPGYYSSRGNLEGVAHRSIIPGQTTRTDILGLLGEPDVSAAAGQWFYYESDFLKDESGVWLMVGVPGAGAVGQWPTTQIMLFRRLFVAFDSNGAVATTDFQEQECHNIPHPTHVTRDYRVSRESLTEEQIKSCDILRRGWELRDRRLRQRLEVETGRDAPSYERFDQAVYKPGIAKTWGERGFDCPYRSQAGTLFISTNRLFYFPVENSFSGTPPDPVGIARKDVTSVKLLEPSLNVLNETFGLVIGNRDGAFVSLSICRAGAYDQPAIRKVFSLLRVGIGEAD